MRRLGHKDHENVISGQRVKAANLGLMGVARLEPVGRRGVHIWTGRATRIKGIFMRHVRKGGRSSGSEQATHVTDVASPAMGVARLKRHEPDLGPRTHCEPSHGQRTDVRLAANAMSSTWPDGKSSSAAGLPSHTTEAIQTDGAAHVAAATEACGAAVPAVATTQEAHMTSARVAIDARAPEQAVEDNSASAVRVVLDMVDNEVDGR